MARFQAGSRLVAATCAAALLCVAACVPAAAAAPTAASVASAIQMFARQLHAATDKMHAASVKTYYKEHGDREDAELQAAHDRAVNDEGALLRRAGSRSGSKHSAGVHSATSGVDSHISGHQEQHSVLLALMRDMHHTAAASGDETIAAHLEAVESELARLDDLAVAWRSLSADALALVDKEKSDVAVLREALSGMAEGYKRGSHEDTSRHVADALAAVRKTHEFVRLLQSQHEKVLESTEQVRVALDEEVARLLKDADSAATSEPVKTGLSGVIIVATEIIVAALQAEGIDVSLGSRVVGYGASAALFRQGQRDASKAVALSTLQAGLAENLAPEVADIVARLHGVEQRYDTMEAMLAHTEHVLRDTELDAKSGHAFDGDVSIFEVADTASRYLEEAFDEYLKYVASLEQEAIDRRSAIGEQMEAANKAIKGRRQAAQDANQAGDSEAEL